jgi:hypothetical protein
MCNDIVDLSFWIFLSGIIFIIPAVIQLRNYLFVGSTSYIVFAALFGFVILDQVIVSLDRDEFIFEILITLSFVSIYFIVIQLSSDIIDNKLPVRGQTWKLFALLVFIFTISMKYFISEEILSTDHTSMRIVIGELYRIFAGYLVVYSFRNTKFVVESDKTNQIRKYWLICGYLIVGTGILRALVYIIKWFLLFVFDHDPDGSGISRLDFYGEIFGVISVLTLGIITLYIAIFHPETMLLSHVQVIKAAHIYDIVEKHSSPRSKEAEKSEYDALIEYINSIPKKLIRKDD